MTGEKLERARRIVEAGVREVLDDVVIDKILVAPELFKQDGDDLDYLTVRAIYEGERERVRGRSRTLRGALRDRLLDEGIADFPLVYICSKSEWERPPDPIDDEAEEQISPRQLERARRIAEAVFDEVMDDVVFERIQVTPDAERFTDDDDLDYLEVRAVYEGQPEELRTRTPKLRHLLRKRLLDEGIPEYPVLHFTMRSDRERHHDPA